MRKWGIYVLVCTKRGLESSNWAGGIKGVLFVPICHSAGNIKGNSEVGRENFITQCAESSE